MLDAVPRLDAASPEWDLDVVSVVESTLEGPRPVLMAQLERVRTETLARLKEEGVEYEERMDVLRDLEHPKPLADFLYSVFDEYRVRHPWARDHDVHPKSIVRDMYERSMGFAEYVAFYSISRSEGVLLRYLSDAYKALVQNVPEELKSATSRDLSEWLGEMVRQVDSSLLDEWELLMHPAELEAALARGERPTPGLIHGEPPPLTSNLRAFRVMVRNASFRRVELAARRDWATLGEMDQEAGWDADAMGGRIRKLLRRAGFHRDWPRGARPGSVATERRWPALAGTASDRRPGRVPRMGHPARCGP